MYVKLFAKQILFEEKFREANPTKPELTYFIIWFNKKRKSSCMF